MVWVLLLECWYGLWWLHVLGFAVRMLVCDGGYMVWVLLGC